ncbi:facilitated trehalose transporter Tret1-like [Eupeodes corollae]|uniref:facilitated trehalose transporter Tret1-like n=1 Tax=Eupeodes corollae TaxID=290404 RepID=UPI002490D3C5|nr:facilitated trehalose transporter Tret1-like [Eupeodes corollae]
MDSSKKSNIYLSSLTNIGYFALGTCTGWTSPVMPKLRNITSDSPLKVSVDYQEEGWISSALTIGALIGCPLAGPLANRVGRKWALLISASIFASAYFLFLLTSTIWQIYVGRVLQGIASGLVCTVMPMYIAEVSTDDTRGPLSSTIGLFMTSGILFVYTIGAFVSYLKLQFCCLAVPLIFFGVFFFMPETPYFYAMKRRKSEAVKSLAFLRCRCRTAIRDEIEQIQSSVDADMLHKGTLPEILRNPPNRKAFLICCGLLSFQELCGTDAVLFNTESIFISAESPLKPAIAAIFVAATQVAISLANPFIIKRFSRKAMLMTSAMGMCLGLFALGLFFYVQTFSDATSILWIPIPALVLFNVMYSLGFGSVTWIVVGEILPTNIKATVSSFATTLNWVLTFVVTRFYPDINELGSYYAFWMFAGLCGLGFLFVLLYVIETKGLSLQEIQEKLNKS